MQDDVGLSHSHARTTGWPSTGWRRLIALTAAIPLLLQGCVTIPPPPKAHGAVHSRYTPRATPRIAAAPLDEISPRQAGQCRAHLEARAAAFTPLPDQFYGAGCATVNTVRLTALSGDSQPFAITNLGPVTCPLADTFAAWARFGVDRAARQYLGSALVKIETMGSYNCRNVAGTDRRSGHATGNAIDVSAFVLADGRRISVLGQWSAGGSQEREFLRVVHLSACKRFGVVLGPEYNVAHRDHFHVELADSGVCR
jgi:hypothetical protein